MNEPGGIIIEAVPRDPTDVEWIRALSLTLESDLSREGRDAVLRELIDMRRPKMVVRMADKKQANSGA